MSEGEDGGTVSQPGGLLGELQNFNRKSLRKTVTRIHTEDGKILQEVRDDSGNYRRVSGYGTDYGFVADMYLDLQVGEIKDYLIFGSQDVAADLDILKKYNVTHILNLATYVKNYFKEKFDYLNITINDTPDTKVIQHFEHAFKFIDKADAKGGCCFVHCNAGVSRASTFVIGYLMKKDKMTFRDAYDYVKSKRTKACPNSGFEIQLKEYEKQLELSKNELQVVEYEPRLGCSNSSW